MTRTACILKCFCSAIVILALASPALCATPRDHEDGFFLRLSAGGGSGQTNLDIPGLKTELSGTSGDVNLAVGGIVAPNLAIHGTLFGWMVSDPDATVGSMSGTISGDISLSAVGAGFTYYVMPTNMYISGSVGAGTLTLETFAGSAESDTGVAVDITVGKEWWVSDRWGLGVAGALGFHSIPDSEPSIDDNWSGTTFGIRFSATMN